MTALPRFKARASALRHKSFVRAFSGIAPYFIVNEFPKCGGTWLSQMLAMAMNIPFRRNEPIRFEPAITHGHFRHPLGLKNVAVLWRDPRDMLVSFYFHCFFVNEVANKPLVKQMRARAAFGDFHDIRANLPSFIKLLSDRPVSPRFSWPEFSEVWVNRPGIVHTRYEDLRRDAPSELVRIVLELSGERLEPNRAAQIAAEFEFSKAKAKAIEKQEKSGGGELSFIREGSVGGWRKYFTEEANQILEIEGYREPMLRLGYPDLG